MIDFAGDLATILNGELGEDALYLPKSGGELTIRVIRRRADDVAGFAEAQLVSETGVFLVSVADVPEPVSGDRIEVAGQIYEMRAAPIRDVRNLRWRIEAFPVG